VPEKVGWRSPQENAEDQREPVRLDEADTHVRSVRNDSALRADAEKDLRKIHQDQRGDGDAPR
jgi:hypothetical protein